MSNDDVAHRAFQNIVKLLKVQFPSRRMLLRVRLRQREHPFLIHSLRDLGAPIGLSHKQVHAICGQERVVPHDPCRRTALSFPLSKKKHANVRVSCYVVDRCTCSSVS